MGMRVWERWVVRQGMEEVAASRSAHRWVMVPAIIKQQSWSLSLVRERVKRVLELKQCSSSCPLETTWVYIHAGISATCGGVPLFGVENRASHLSVSRTTLEKIWRIGVLVSESADGGEGQCWAMTTAVYFASTPC